MSKKYRVSERTQKIEIINKETGEINEETLTTQKVFSLDVDSSQFYMTFLDNLPKLWKLTKVERNILDFLMLHCKYDTGIVTVATANKLRFCKETEIRPSSFANSLITLQNKGLLYKGEYKQEYVISPDIMWKGSNKGRVKMLHIIFKAEYEK